MVKSEKGIQSFLVGKFPLRTLLAVYMTAIIGGLSLSLWQEYSAQEILIAHVTDTDSRISELEGTAQKYQDLLQDDQVVRNASLSATIASIEQTYSNGANLFEARADLAVSGARTRDIDISLASFLSYLGKKDYEGAQKQATETENLIVKLQADLAPKIAAPAGQPQASPIPNNTLPGSGYSRQSVSTPNGNFTVSMVIAPGARAIVETAGDSDCADNCPVKSLAEHVSASGGFAGINGAYFCPPDYPRCAGKVNTFDTLAVNGRTKAVLNRDNNVYSTVPLIAMYGSNVSFYDQTVQWGIDTSSGGALANYPMLVRGGQAASGDQNGKGTRGFFGKKGDAIVMGHIYSASFGDAAQVLVTLGLDNAINLDGGGSTALWYEGGYKAGPGRLLPTAIVLVR